MSYLVLARKWRPRKFSEVAGQAHVVRALENALTTGRVHHAFLFAGTRGVGKTTIARILAKALNCEAGVSAEPCGSCAACVAVDEGRFVDLIEVDAASRTGVDDTRDLLDNVQYTPTNGRFKVYLIDEVHMLSRQSFNALLKTLEEPPPHVKFLFATTDPQKLPVTVLSRCLQFNLKRLSGREIVDRMTEICGAEDLAAEPAALVRIGRAAAGSMRDGLSLLDQALAYGADKLVDGDVAEMLGSMDRHRIVEIIQGLADGDGAELLARIGALDELVPDFDTVLDELATALQRIAVIQVAGPDALEDEEELEALQALAERIDAERLQLFYQIAVTSRRDIGLAPEPRLGFEMALLRMLAFVPAGAGPVSAPPPGNAARPAAAPAARPKSRTPKRDAAPAAAAAQAVSAPEDLQDWPAFVTGLGVEGAVRQLAENSALQSCSPFELRLGVERRNEHLLTDNLKSRLAVAVQGRIGGGINVMFSVTDAALDTIAGQVAEAAEEDIRNARDTIQNDPDVQQIVDAFGGEVVPDSIRPVRPDD
ncbi:MAG: DNA polymerase III subunit gamma/tau [Gammaproteobacteria bacterium]